jgi:endonuclease/exonuclease/phosphatase family metal-dependent hydrolase
MQRPTAGNRRPRVFVLCISTVAVLASCSNGGHFKSSPSLSIIQDSRGVPQDERQIPSKALFSYLDPQGHRLSLILDGNSLTLNEAGNISYSAVWGPGESNPLERLLSGDEIPVTATRGHEYGQRENEAILRLRNQPNVARSDDDSRSTNGLPNQPLPIELVLESGTVALTADLKEEPAGHEFTIVSYNVENFFDQVDEDRNADYGDYRLQKNPKGQWSNYGDKVIYDGQTMSFTNAKAQNIRKALTALSAEGPEVVGLVEVESRHSLDTLLRATKDLGYKYAQFSDWPSGSPKPAMGMGVLSKFPITSWTLLTPKFAEQTALSDTSEDSSLTQQGRKKSRNDTPRSILKVTVDVYGHPLLIYVNHWKSKAGPESKRKAYAEAVQRDLDQVLKVNPRTDFVLLGDFNSEYNEAVILTDEHNDTNGTTGINHVLKTQGDELAVANARTPYIKYDLHYELEPDRRRSAWHPGFNWSSLDHIIIGPGLYDQQGITYVDGSFDIPQPEHPLVEMLFNHQGKTKRWMARREGPFTRHSIGGFSDHLPIYARFRVASEQSDSVIPLPNAGKPDTNDVPIESEISQN